MSRRAAWPAGAAFGVALLVALQVSRAIVSLGAGPGGDVVAFALSLRGLACVAAGNAAVLVLIALVTARLADPGAPVASTLRLGRGRATAAGWLAAIAATCGASLACSAAANLAGVGQGRVMQAVATSVASGGGQGLAVGTVALALVPGLAEETFFRGLIQTRLVAAWGPVPGVVVASIAFGAFHLDPVQGSLAALLGLVLGATAERFQSIRPTIVAHTANNLLFVILAHQGAASPGHPLPALVLGLAITLPSLLLLRSRASSA